MSKHVFSTKRNVNKVEFATKKKLTTIITVNSGEGTFLLSFFQE